MNFSGASKGSATDILSFNDVDAADLQLGNQVMWLKLMIDYSDN